MYKSKLRKLIIIALAAVVALALIPMFLIYSRSISFEEMNLLAAQPFVEIKINPETASRQNIDVTITNNGPYILSRLSGYRIYRRGWFFWRYVPLQWPPFWPLMYFSFDTNASYEYAINLELHIRCLRRGEYAFVADFSFGRELVVAAGKFILP